MEFIRKTAKWIVMLVCAVLFLWIVDNIFENDIDKFDYIIYSMVLITMHPITTSFFKIITYFGDWMIIIPVCIICVIFLKEKRYKYLVASNLVIIFILNQALKMLFNRQRPVGNRLIEASGYSFPSGHSMISMAFYGLLIYLAYKNIKNKKLKYAICIGLTLLIVLIGISRIYLGVHYASDVAGGFLLSIAYLIVFTQITKAKQEV